MHILGDLRHRLDTCRIVWGARIVISVYGQVLEGVALCEGLEKRLINITHRHTQTQVQLCVLNRWCVGVQHLRHQNHTRMVGLIRPPGWREIQKFWSVVIIDVEFIRQCPGDVMSVITNLHFYAHLDVIDTDVVCIDRSSGLTDTSSTTVWYDAVCRSVMCRRFSVREVI